MHVPWLAWISIFSSLGIAALSVLPVVGGKEVSEMFDVLVYGANAAGVRHRMMRMTTSKPPNLTTVLRIRLLPPSLRQMVASLPSRWWSH